MRAVNQAVLRRRDSSSRALPAGEMATRQTRRSAGSGVRVTRPSHSSFDTTFVIEGGATRSCSASAPRVSGPWLAMTARADCWVGDNPAPDSWRRRRASRVALNRNRAAISGAAATVVRAGDGEVRMPDSLPD